MDLNSNRRTVLILGTPTSDDAAAVSSDDHHDVSWFEDGRLLLAEACIAADGWLAHAAWSTPPPPPPMIILIAAPPPGLLEALESYAPDLLIQDGDSDLDAAAPIESLQDVPPPTLRSPEPITPDEIAMLLDMPLDPPDGREPTP